jgi:diguanylate cyclase (GGDEF)-like protein
MGETKELKGLIDISIWKKVQDDFSSAIRGTILTLDENMGILVQSREFPFFCQIINSIDKSMCKNCWEEHVKQIKLSNENIQFYYCPAGLLNIIAPIKMDARFLGAIVCCGILKDTRFNVETRKIAELLKIEPEELTDALKEIPAQKEEDIRLYGTLLHILSKTVPEIAHQKQLTEKRIMQLTTLHKISQMVNSTLELEKILRSIMTFMVDSMHIDDCSIIIFNGTDESDRYYFQESPKETYKIIEKILHDDLIVSKSIIINNSVRKDSRFRNLEHPLASIAAVPLKIRGEISGVINLYSESSGIQEEDKEFLTIIADQVAVALGNARYYEAVKELAITDKLTGLYNRSYFMEALKQEVIRARTYKTPLSVSMLDIDFFKQYNDIFGHIQGDKILAEISALIKKSLRQVDIPGRYGGEEFIIISPETSNEIVVEIMEKLRKSIDEYPFEGRDKQPGKKLTMSAGIVTTLDPSLRSEDLLKEADKALYKAKDAGRNRVMSTIILNKNFLPLDVQEANEFYKR